MFLLKWNFYVFMILKKLMDIEYWIFNLLWNLYVLLSLLALMTMEIYEQQQKNQTHNNYACEDPNWMLYLFL